MLAWRIADDRWPLFDGGGAARRGGRWNSPGRGVIYAGSSYAIGALEILVRTGRQAPPRHHAFIRIDIPDAVHVERLEVNAVTGWDEPGMEASRRFGDSWLRSARTAVLLVPSAVTRIDFTVVINPAHPDFAAITSTQPRPVEWDARLFGGAVR